VIGRRRFFEIATVGVIGGGSFVTLLRAIGRGGTVFGADRSFVTMNGKRVGPRTGSSDEAQLIAGWLNGGGYADLTN
jgi:hypothetical protein